MSRIFPPAVVYPLFSPQTLHTLKYLHAARLIDGACVRDMAPAGFYSAEVGQTLSPIGSERMVDRLVHPGCALFHVALILQGFNVLEVLLKSTGPYCRQAGVLKPYVVFDVEKGRELSHSRSRRNVAEANMAAALYLELRWDRCVGTDLCKGRVPFSSCLIDRESLDTQVQCPAPVIRG